MPLEKREVERGLIGKGFYRYDKKHIFFRYVTLNGKHTSIVTHISRSAGGRDITAGLIGAMASQCKISKNQFNLLVSCELTREDYEKLLLEKGLINPDLPT